MEPRPTLPPRGVVMVSPARQRIVFGPPGPATQCFGLPSQATHCFGLPSQEIQALFRRAGGRVAHPLDPTYTHQKRPRVDPPPNHGLPVACKNSTPPRSGVGRRTEAVAARGRGCDPTPLTSFDRRPFQPPGFVFQKQRIVFGPPGPATQCFGLPSQEVQTRHGRAGGRVAHPLDPTSPPESVP